MYYLWVTLDPKIVHGVAQQLGLAQHRSGCRAGGEGYPEAAHRKGARKEKRLKELDYLKESVLSYLLIDT